MYSVHPDSCVKHLDKLPYLHTPSFYMYSISQSKPGLGTRPSHGKEGLVPRLDQTLKLHLHVCIYNQSPLTLFNSFGGGY